MSENPTFSYGIQSAVFAKKHLCAAMQEWNHVSECKVKLQEINIAIQRLLPQCAPAPLFPGQEKVVSLQPKSLTNNQAELARKQEEFTQALLSLCNHVRIQIHTAQKAVELLDDVDIELEHKDMIDSRVHIILDTTTHLLTYYGAMLMDACDASFKKYEDISVPEREVTVYCQAIMDVHTYIKNYLGSVHPDLVKPMSPIWNSIVQENDSRFAPTPTKWRSPKKQ